MLVLFPLRSLLPQHRAVLIHCCIWLLTLKDAKTAVEVLFLEKQALFYSAPSLTFDWGRINRPFWHRSSLSSVLRCGKAAQEARKKRVAPLDSPPPPPYFALHSAPSPSQVGSPSPHHRPDGAAGRAATAAGASGGVLHRRSRVPGHCRRRPRR